MWSMNFYWKMITHPLKKRVVKSWLFRRTDINCLYFLPQIIGSHESCTSKRFLDKNPKINLQIFIGPTDPIWEYLPQESHISVANAFFSFTIDMHEFWVNWKVLCLSWIKMERNKNLLILCNLLQRQQFHFLKLTLVILSKLSK